VLHLSEQIVSTLTFSVQTVYGNSVLCLCDYSVVFVLLKCCVCVTTVLCLCA